MLSKISIDAQGVGSIADEIQVMVVNKSGLITGKFGNYKIVTCKDIKNQKNSVNLYRNLIDSVEVGEIYVLTNIKVGNYKKDDEVLKRVGTTIRSRVIKASAQVRLDFKNEGIMLGDKFVRGSIIGISELNVYESCAICWCKVDSTNECRKCKKKVEEKKIDFNLVMYIQVEGSDDEVLDIFCFKSTLNLQNEDEDEINEETLNMRLDGKICDAEYNIEDYGDQKKMRLVKFKLGSS